MLLSQHLAEYISACFTGLWIQSHEHDDALTEIAQLCREQNWRLAVWDIASGLQIPGQNNPTDAGSSDPLAAIRSINALASADSSAILVLANFHRFLNSPEIVQALAKQISTGKANRTFIVILSAVVQIPAELEKHFVVLDHDLPGREQLEQIARGIATEDDDLPQGEEMNTVLDAAAGLTRYEAEGAYSLSIVRHGNIRPDAIWELKSQTLKKSGLLQLHRGGERFDGLGGLQSLKGFCLRAMRRQGHRDPLRRPRGVLLLGVPGTGKSAFAKTTEVILTNSRWTGEPIRISTNRMYLQRAMTLGLNDLSLYGDDKALLCQTFGRKFVWMPLDKGAAIEPADDVIRIESPQGEIAAAIPKPVTPEEVPPMSEPINTTSKAASNGQAETQAKPEAKTRKTSRRKASQQDLAALIDQATEFRSALHTLVQQSNGLVKALKQHRRQSKAIQNTLASLKQLKTLGV